MPATGVAHRFGGELNAVELVLPSSLTCVDLLNGAGCAATDADWLCLLDAFEGHVPLGGERTVERSAALSADGQRVVTASDEMARVWALSAHARRQALRAATTDCIVHALRRTYLDESDEDARPGDEPCERAHGRTPFTPDAAAP
ncbi:hypothetical protein WMF28_24375 [Sorangium sp. So ce590]|uniref:hypothetical protein n=1 Tax=Sorangium sp. So ce590 TaxID=3133317 RepID=UPI003F5EE7A6